MARTGGCTLPENTRRYYLDAMGIQCWQTRAADQAPEQLTEPLAGTSSKLLTPVAGEGAAAAASLQEQVAACRLCVLHRTRQQVIVGRGDKTADLLFVLLAPEQADEKAGELCSGEAGELFGKMLGAIDIDIDSVYITTLLKCSVPEKHTVSPAEVEACRGHLRWQLAQMRPKLIVVLGETAAQCLLQKNLALDVLRESGKPAARNLEASPFRFESLPVLPGYSPHELLQQPQNKRKAWMDLQLLQSLLQEN